MTLTAARPRVLTLRWTALTVRPLSGMVNGICSLRISETTPTLTPVLAATWVQDSGLLSSLRAHAEPTQSERIAVDKILSDEFSRHLRPDYEPTERGRDVDNLLGTFLLRWPITTD